MERAHENYARWKVVAITVIRKKVENDMEDGSGEEEGSKQGSSDQEGKTSGMWAEDYAEQEEDGASA